MKQFTTTIFLLFCSLVNAQINFERGYIINNQNERTECFIKNIDWKYNPSNIEYKLNIDDSKTKNASISELVEFSIYNECKYKRFTLNIEKSRDDLQNLSNKKEPVWEKATVLLKVLIEGDANLFVYSENNLIKYFYKTKSIDTEQLVFIKYETSESSQNQLNNFSNSIKTNNHFRQQLYNNVKCDNMDMSDFDKIGYNKSELVKHFLKYNSCSGNYTSDFISKTQKGILSFKVSAGINTVNLSINDPNVYYNKSTDINGEMAFSFGAEIEYILPFNKNKWGLFINPLYSKVEADKKYIKKTGLPSGEDFEHNVKVKYTAIEIPIGFRHYMFLNDNSKIFINGMYVINLSPSSQIVFNNDEVYDIDPRGNFSLGIGYCYKNKISAELRSNLGKEILGSYNEWSTKYNSIGILLNYKIF